MSTTTLKQMVENAAVVVLVGNGEVEPSQDDLMEIRERLRGFLPKGLGLELLVAAREAFEPLVVKSQYQNVSVEVSYDDELADEAISELKT